MPNNDNKQLKLLCCWAGSPCLVVVGGDSCSNCSEFESQYCILDRHCFTLICFKNCNFCLKKTENKLNRGWEWPVLLNYCAVDKTSFVVLSFGS